MTSTLRRLRLGKKKKEKERKIERRNHRMKIQCPHLLRTQGGHNKNIVISAYVSISSTGIRRFRYMTVSVHTLSVHVFFGTAVFGTLNVNIGTVTFGTYKISVQSTSAHKCQFRYNHLRYKGTLVLDKLKPFMVALWNRADHYIFILWFLSIYLSSIFFSFLA